MQQKEQNLSLNEIIKRKTLLLDDDYFSSGSMLSIQRPRLETGQLSLQNS